jgi:hypothetical protein
MAKEIDLLNILSDGEKGLLNINDYLAISLIPLAVDKIESEVLTELQSIKNILKSPTSIVDQDVMDTLKKYMEKLKIQYPLQSNNDPMKIYFENEITTQKCIKSLTLAFHFIHVKKNKYKLDSTIEQKIYNNSENLNEQFKTSVPSFKRTTFSTGCYYRMSDKQDVSFVTPCLYTIEERIQKNNDEHYQKDKKDLKFMISYAILGNIENRTHEEIYQVIKDYEDLFRNNIIDRIDNEKEEEFKIHPSLAFLDELEEMFVEMEYLIPEKSGIRSGVLINDFKPINFMQDIAEGIIKLKTYNGASGISKTILTNMLETYNNLLPKLNKPNINDNDIKNIVNNQIIKFNNKNKLKK